MRRPSEVEQQLQSPDLTALATTQPVAVEQAITPEVASTLTQLMIGSENFTGGTGQIPGVQIASKTGTAEHGTDPRNTPPHALYIAFAPADDPKIAIAAVVENAGFGAASAAPITRRVFDYWLLNQYPSEEDLAAVRKGQAGAPVGKPRNATEVAWPPANGAVAAAPAVAASAPVAAAKKPVAVAQSGTPRSAR